MAVDREHNQISDAGMLLCNNTGINSNGEFVLYDFGTPRADVLDNEQKKRLLQLIWDKAHSDKPELPIKININTGDYDGFENGSHSMSIQDWYLDALKVELNQSNREKSPFGVGPNNYMSYLDVALKQLYRFTGKYDGNIGHTTNGYKEKYPWNAPNQWWEISGEIGGFGSEQHWRPKNLAKEVELLITMSRQVYGTYYVTTFSHRSMDSKVTTPQVFIDNMVDTRPKPKTE